MYGELSFPSHFLFSETLKSIFPLISFFPLILSCNFHCRPATVAPSPAVTRAPPSLCSHFSLCGETPHQQRPSPATVSPSTGSLKSLHRRCISFHLWPPHPSTSRHHKVKRLYELCKTENSEDLVARVYPQINRLFQRSVASLSHSRNSNGLLLLAILQFYLDFGEAVLHDPDPSLRTFFRSCLSRCGICRGTRRFDCKTKKNRHAGNVEKKAEPTHVGGSISSSVHAARMVEAGEDPTPPKVFMQTHRRQDSSFVNERSRLIAERYEQFLVVADRGNDIANQYHAFRQAAGGVDSRRRIIGLGVAAPDFYPDLFAYDMPRCRYGESSRDAGPSSSHPAGHERPSGYKLLLIDS